MSLFDQLRSPHGEEGEETIARMNIGHRPQYKWGMANIPGGFSPRRILDVGCGGGVFTRLILDRYPEAMVCGIDISSLSISSSADLNADYLDSGRLFLYEGDVMDMPFDDGQFDLVISNDSHFFWPDVPKGLKEVSRVLKEGGMVCFTADPHFVTEQDIPNEYRGQMNTILDRDMVGYFRDANMDVECIEKEGTGICAYVGTKRSC